MRGRLRSRPSGTGRVVLALGRAGHRQVAPNARFCRRYRDRAAHPAALFLLAATIRQRRSTPLSCQWSAPPGSPARHGADEARQARGACWRPALGTGRPSLHPEMLSLPAASAFPPLAPEPAAQEGRLTLAALAATSSRPGAAAAGPDDLRRRRIGLIDLARLLDLTVETITSLAGAVVDHFPARVPTPWIGHSQVTAIALDRLGRREVRDPVHRARRQSRDAAARFVDADRRASTDGVPLFVEELTKAVVEAGADRGCASMSAVPPSSFTVPATLHASFWGASTGSARRPGLRRRSAPSSAATFSYELLAAAAPLAEPRTPRGTTPPRLEALASSSSAACHRRPHTCSSTRWSRTPPTAPCYASPRQALHRRIAEALGSGFRTSSQRGRRSCASLRRSRHRRQGDRLLAPRGEIVGGQICRA